MSEDGEKVENFINNVTLTETSHINNFTLQFPLKEKKVILDTENSESLINNLACCKKFKVIGFYLTGLCCYIPLNVILSGLDVYKEFEYSEFTFPIFYLISFFILQLLISISSPKFSYYTLIQISLFITTICLFLIPFIKIYVDSGVFLYTIICIFMLGCASSTLNACLCSIMIYLEKKFIISIIAGNATSGLIINLWRLFTLFNFDIKINNNEENLKLSFFIFSYITGIFVLISMVVWYIFIKEIDVRKALRRIHPTLVMFDEDVDFEERCLSLCSYKTDENYSSNLNLPKISEYKKFISIIKNQTFINFFIFIHGFITYAVYPGIFFKCQILFDNTSFSIIAVLLIHNFYNLCGRFISKIYYFKKFLGIFIIITLRFIFLIVFFIIYFNRIKIKDDYINNNEKCIFTNNDNKPFPILYPFYYNDYSIAVYLSIFSLTNGLVINNSFFLVENYHINPALKNKSSVVLNITLHLGFLVGSVSSFMIIWLIKI